MILLGFVKYQLIAYSWTRLPEVPDTTAGILWFISLSLISNVAQKGPTGL